MASPTPSGANQIERCADCGEPFIDGCCRTMECAFIWKRVPMPESVIAFSRALEADRDR